ncbi:MAG: transcriptional regulator [Candidatus Eisenbacteria bacterium]|nr:transcriptional regulator [Candidatus Eisenbacteria bacterium]
MGRRLTFDEHLTSAPRLAIIAALARGETLSFTELKDSTGLSDGNLHVQAHRLADAGYVRIRKAPRGRRNLTYFAITEVGLRALKLHVRKLQALLATKSGLLRPTRAARQTPNDAQVWHQRG